MKIKVRTLIIFIISLFVLIQILGGHSSKEYNDLYKTLHRDVNFEVDYKDLIFDIKTLSEKGYARVHSDVSTDKQGNATLSGEGYEIRASGLECNVYIGDELVHTFDRHTAGLPIVKENRLSFPFIIWLVILFAIYCVAYTAVVFVFKRFVFKTMMLAGFEC